MSYEIIEALGQLIKDKNIDRKFLMETIKEGLSQAAKKKFGLNNPVEVEINDKSGTLDIFIVKQVVNSDLPEDGEIDINKAKEINPSVKVGEDLKIQLPFAAFGRTAIQAAKQVIIQRIREAERKKIYDEYSGRVFEVVTGHVQQVDRGSIIVGLGETEGIIPISETIKRERYRLGELVKAIIIEVKESTKGPQVVLSRTHPQMLLRLFEQEVHEISEGIVEIKSVAREAGERSKIAVYSKNSEVDPVGACVGMKGSRVQNIVQEFNGERIDIVPWSSEPAIFISKALSPAKVEEVIIEKDGGDKVITVVKEDQLSLAIGKAGQNARLAAALTGYKIDIISEEEYNEMQRILKEEEVEVKFIPNITEKLAQKLIASGYETIQDLMNVDKETLIQIPGIGEKSIEKILEGVAIAIGDIERKKALRLAQKDPDLLEKMGFTKDEVESMESEGDEEEDEEELIDDDTEIEDNKEPENSRDV